MSERYVKATEGWTPLEFYAYIIRTLGLPARFHFDGKVRTNIRIARGGGLWLTTGPS